MTLRFRPMPGLTAAVLICLPILIGLGVWQYQRWKWKLGILDEVEAAVTASPIQGLSGFNTALEQGEPLDFRRIELTAQQTNPVWYLYRPQNGLQWQPFREVQSEGLSALAGFPTIDDRVKPDENDQAESADPEATLRASHLPDMAQYAGYIRRIRPRTGMAKWVGSENNTAQNRWFEINPNGAWMVGATHFVDIHPRETDAEALPIRRPDIANNHVSYMLTWWSFAIIMLVIYAILHRRAGRLSW